VGAAATQTLPASYATPGTPTAVQAPVARRTRYENTAGLPAVGHDEEEERRGHKGRAALITVLALVLLGLIGWLAVTWFGNQQPDVKMVAVPSIVNLQESQANQALATSNLRGEKSSAPSTTVAEGRVISQDPKAGGQVAEQSVIRFVVSTGPESVQVPDVSGMKKDDARAELEKQGFTVAKFVEENTPDQDKNKVTKTDPPANSTVAAGSDITIYYATGNVQVPDDLVGKDWTQAVIALQNAGLNPKKEPVDSDKPADQVLDVEKGGDVVKAGSTITVKVAKTPTPQPSTTTVTVPPPTTPPTTAGTTTGGPLLP
jgi:serine/threonine-protein kinase